MATFVSDKHKCCARTYDGIDVVSPAAPYGNLEEFIGPYGIRMYFNVSQYTGDLIITC